MVTVAAPRGLIVDRQDTVLAGNETENEIVLSRQQAAQNPSVIGKVAALVTQTPSQVQADVTDVQYSPYEPVPILRTAPQATVQYLDNHASEYPGVSVEQVTQRQYPQGGATAAYVLGYVGAITGTELKAHPDQGYTESSQIGKTGVEAQYEQYLRGQPGKQYLEVNAQGTVVGTLRTVRATQGDTVVLNLTLGLQRYAQQALTADMAADRQRTTSGRIPKATDGAVVVLTPRPGRCWRWPRHPPTASQHGSAASPPSTTRSSPPPATPRPPTPARSTTTPSRVSTPPAPPSSWPPPPPPCRTG